MKKIILPALALAFGAGFFAAAPQAQAAFGPSQLQAPSLVDDVACVTRQVRTVRPNGRVIYRTERQCGVAPRGLRGDRCRVERERVVRPGGRVIYREVRRCR
jgi:hypothetical protein